MKTFKDAMKAKFSGKKVEDTYSFPIFDEARYNQLVKNFEDQKAEMIEVMERLGADLSSIR